MAKLDRKRSIFFGSWTGSAITEAATATYTPATSGSSTPSVTVTAATFGTKIGSESGTYTFKYASSGTAWKLNGTTVTLSEYGLTVTGEPANNDTIIVVYTAASTGWEALGKDNDELTKELNPDTETEKNVLGETTFKHSGYEPEIELDPYYMDPSHVMYSKMLENALEEKYGESDLVGYFVEAFFTEANETTHTMTGYGFKRKAWFVPQSTGGDTSGYAIPFTVNPIGAMTRVTVSYDMSTNEATITSAT